MAIEDVYSSIDRGNLWRYCWISRDLLRIEESEDDDCLEELSEEERSTKQRRTSNGIISVEEILVESKYKN